MLLVKDVVHERKGDVTKVRQVIIGLAAERAVKAEVALAGRSIILDMVQSS